jgi:hypothetical protein
MSHWRTSSQEAYSSYAAPQQPSIRTHSQPSGGMLPQLTSPMSSPSFNSYSGFNGTSINRPLTTQQQKLQQSPYGDSLQRIATKHQPNLLPALGSLSLTMTAPSQQQRNLYNPMQQLNQRSQAQSSFANTLAANTQPLSAASGTTMIQPPQRKKNHLTSQFQANKSVLFHSTKSIKRINYAQIEWQKQQTNKKKNNISHTTNKSYSF